MSAWAFRHGQKLNTMFQSNSYIFCIRLAHTYFLLIGKPIGNLGAVGFMADFK